MKTIETERFLLRKLTVDDGLDLYTCTSSLEVASQMPWEPHQTLQETQAFIEAQNKRDVYVWGIVCKLDKKVIGTIELRVLPTEYAIGEVSFMLAPDCWEKGVMPEAMTEVFRFGFETLKLVRIQGRCLVENIGSARALRKAGMSFEGVIRRGTYLKGAFGDLRMYSILNIEFEA